MELRPYQQAAIDCLDAWLAARDDNPCIVIPTGGGKTVVFASLIRRYLHHWPSTRILVLAHVKELVEQNARKLAEAWPEAPMGVYSAGLGQRDLQAAVTFAGIQSAYRVAEHFGHIDLVFIDEAHRIPIKGEGMYRTLLNALQARNPALRVVGFTATPYRMGAGPVCAPQNILHGTCYEIGVRDLINQGYLSPLVSRGSKARADLRGVRVRQGDYVADEVEAAVMRDGLPERTAAEIVRLAEGRRAWIVFCAGKAHAEAISQALHAEGIAAPVIHEGTPADERDRLIKQFRAGELRALCNINVLSEGFDAPHIDCVVMLRPTKSAGLYYQQAGRGLRLAEGKDDCLVLDFAGNVLEHGPIDAIRAGAPPKKGKAPVKECPDCGLHQPAGVRACGECGHEWPAPERAAHDPHGDAAVEGAILREPPQRFEVEDVEYRIWTKPGKPDSLRVDYYCLQGMSRYSEWVCVGHDGYARTKAVQWWRARTHPDAPVPASAEAALAGTDNLRRPVAILVDVNGKYPEILAAEIGEMTKAQVTDDVPF